jgi:hypothetical protein
MTYVHPEPIHPFNISTEDYEQMYAGDPPSKLGICIVHVKGRASTTSGGHVPRRRRPGVRHPAWTRQGRSRAGRKTSKS